MKRAQESVDCEGRMKLIRIARGLLAVRLEPRMERHTLAKNRFIGESLLLGSYEGLLVSLASPPSTTLSAAVTRFLRNTEK